MSRKHLRAVPVDAADALAAARPLQRLHVVQRSVLVLGHYHGDVDRHPYHGYGGGSFCISDIVAIVIVAAALFCL